MASRNGKVIVLADVLPQSRMLTSAAARVAHGMVEQAWHDARLPPYGDGKKIREDARDWLLGLRENPAFSIDWCCVALNIEVEPLQRAVRQMMAAEREYHGTTQASSTTAAVPQLSRACPTAAERKGQDAQVQCGAGDSAAPGDSGAGCGLPAARVPDTEGAQGEAPGGSGGSAGG